MTKYTEAIEALTERIDGIVSRLDKDEDGHQVTLGEVVRRQEETNRLFREQNGAIRKNTEALVGLMQWQKDHCEMHDGLDAHIDYINKKVNVVTALEALWAPIAAMLGSLLRLPPSSGGA